MRPRAKQTNILPLASFMLVLLSWSCRSLQPLSNDELRGRESPLASGAASKHDKHTSTELSMSACQELQQSLQSAVTVQGASNKKNSNYYQERQSLAALSVSRLFPTSTQLCLDDAEISLRSPSSERYTHELSSFLRTHTSLGDKQTVKSIEMFKESKTGSPILLQQRHDPKDGKTYIVVVNWGHIALTRYQLANIEPGAYCVTMDSDAERYDGTGILQNRNKYGALIAFSESTGEAQTVLTLPYLGAYSTIILERQINPRASTCLRL